MLFERMIFLKKNYNKKKTEQLLADFEAYKNSLEYYRGLAECGISSRQAVAVASKIKYLTHMISTVENALALLSPTELDIITKLYWKHEMTFDDVCESCALERSSIYRYRTSALSKMSKAIFGVD